MQLGQLPGELEPAGVIPVGGRTCLSVHSKNKRGQLVGVDGLKQLRRLDGDIRGQGLLEGKFAAGEVLLLADAVDLQHCVPVVDANLYTPEWDIDPASWTASISVG